MSTAVETKGLKRICRECSARFYDFNKRPIICPGCGTEFVGEVKTKGRRGRAAVANDEKAGQVARKTAAEKPGRSVQEDEDEDETDLDEDEFVSLDEVEELEDDDDIDDDEFEVDLELDEDIDIDDDLGDLEDIDIDEDEESPGDGDDEKGS